jgi:hypothetical protein
MASPVQKLLLNGAGNRQHGKRQRTLPFSFALIIRQSQPLDTPALIN